MKNQIFAMGSMVLALFLASFSQSKAQTPPTDCDTKLLSYKNWKETPTTQWNLTLQSPSGGSLEYIGTTHTSDPTHAQFAQIKQAWNTLKPTLAFFEGPNRGVAATEEETIKQFGESGYVRFLAQADGIKTVTLEMSPQEEIDQLLKSSRFSKEQVKLFFVLREASRLRERKVLNEDQLKTAITQLLQKANTMIKGFDGVIPDLAALQVAYQKYWTAPVHWWEAPTAWFDPLGDSLKTGGNFTNDINRQSSENRNAHMYRILSEAVLRGERVLAVVGRNHVPMQAEALKCALTKKANP
ncbi:hypothetical protein [Rufibacter hautae]|uniref:TraB/GumN family protein n=1 Tax=Rufibacter hautae TaxID=2595005 RepID=A0A5B6TCL7_9BACT|nr:hypothetical protein [Rufibacter hautae]KAA3436691.1 hypothetical protein FOA19_20135 [Rufibacter hautae]